MSQPFRDAIMETVSSYFLLYSPLRHQLETFNYFIEYQLPQIVKEYQTLIVESENGNQKHVIEFTHVRMTKPQIVENNGSVRNLGPKEAIDRKLTYDAKVLVDMTHNIYKGTETLVHTQKSQQVELCTIPVMVGCKFCHSQDRSSLLSQQCPVDVLGYFIVNGNEKTVVAQERLRPNYAYVSLLKRSGKTFYQCEIRSWNENKLRSTSTLYITLNRQKNREDCTEVKFSVPFIENVPIPLIRIYELLGTTDLAMIKQLLLGCDEFTPLLEPIVHTILVTNAPEPIANIYEWIGNKATKQKLLPADKKKKAIIHIFNNEFLPHIGLWGSPCGSPCGSPSNSLNWRKTLYISYAVRKLLLVSLGAIPPDDRDHYINKRLHCTGVLMAYQFRQLLIQYMKNLSLALQKAAGKGVWVEAADLANPKLITSGFKYAMSTGKWGMAKGSSTQDGVAQVLIRMNPQSMLGHGRRINTPLNRDGKIPKPRQLNPSHRGIICNVETPEGESCGLLKNLALLTHVRLGSPSSQLVNLILKHSHVSDILTIEIGRLFKEVWIFVNGTPIGWATECNAEILIDELRSYRRNDDIPFDTSIVFDRKLKYIWLYTDMGCCLRPVILANQVSRFWEVYHAERFNPYLWSGLKSAHVIDYIDKEEEEYNTTVANTIDEIEVGVHTHVELDPTFMMGIPALTIPFPDHNQAPRNIYGTIMAKQSIGIPSLRHVESFDTAAHVLEHIERPLVSTQTAHVTRYYDLPSGQNIIVAIMSMVFNQEDSLVVNRRSIDNGLFRSVAYRSYIAEERVNGAEREEFGIPERVKTTQMQNANYKKLNEYGFMEPGTKVEPGDVVIGKVMHIPAFGRRTRKETTQIDKSVILHPNEATVLDRVMMTTGRDGNTIIRCKTRSIRIPEIGDKFSNTSGQKGTVGIILPPEDMPFTNDGLIPDVIINPHCIPSRMTIGLLMEMALGMVSAMRGCRGDGTAFNGVTVEQIGDELHRYGFARHGSTTMYDGRTGKRFESEIFIGPAYYYKLRHMVVDKLHARHTGPRQILTQQPVEGRSRGGGLKLGEMERDSLIAHGASSFLRDRLCVASDGYTAYICNRCGWFAQPPHPKIQDSIISNLLPSGVFCHSCGTDEHVKAVTIPYAYKLLTQELLGCQLGLKHHTS